MRIGGVFVGLSAQADIGIRALGFGARDAERLCAAFSDSNEENEAPAHLLHLLVNESATGVAIQTAIEEVVKAAENGECDIVYVHFSGHGTPNGELVAYDTYRNSIATTSVPLHSLSEALARIRSVDVVITLDSCFSGTVLGWPESPNANAFATFMADLSGDARAVVWAADAQEPAFEAPALGHGYLSYGLLSTLRNARANGHETLPTTTWLQGAIDQAQGLLIRDGYPQNPGAHLRMRAGAVVPIPPMGVRQRAFAVADGIHPVSEDLSSLAVYGFTSEDLACIERRIGRGARLNQLQQEAVSSGGVLAGVSVLIRAPTTAGKTLVGELAILRHWKEGRKAIVLSPTRALVAEHAPAFRESYGPLGMRIVQSTGEHVDDDDLLLGNQYDVAFLTYEKFAAILSMRPHCLDNVGVVVIDEIQLVSDEQRGGNCELLLLRLRHRVREGLPQIVALCGEVSDLKSLDTWLNLRVVGPVERPIPLREGVIGPEGVYRFIRTDSSFEGREVYDLPLGWATGIRFEREIRAVLAIELAKIFVADGKRVLMFVTTQPRALQVATRLAAVPGLESHHELIAALERIPSADRHRTTEGLLAAAGGGVGVHTAGLEADERRAVEQAFRDGSLRAVVATTTLAVGINTPADVVLIVDTEFWRGVDRPPEPLDGQMYRNMAGRAGRLLPYGPPEGSAYLVAHSQPECVRLWNSYVSERSFALTSTLERLGVADRCVALLGILGDGGLQDLVDISGRTLWGYQQEGAQAWASRERAEFEATIEELVADGLVIRASASSMRLSPLGKVASALILRVASVRRIRRALDVIVAAGEPVDDLALVVLAQLATELEGGFVPDTVSVPSVVTATAPGALFEGRQATFTVLIDETDIPPEADPTRVVTERFRRFAGVRDWIQGRDLADVEARYAGTGLGPALNQLRALANRTEDVMLGVGAIVAAEVPALTDQLRVAVPRLRSRLEVGGSAEAGRLFRLRLGLSRRQCLELVRLGIASREDLDTAIEARPVDLERLLSSPGLQALKVQIGTQRARPRGEASPDQLLLDILQGGAGF